MTLKNSFFLSGILFMVTIDLMSYSILRKNTEDLPRISISWTDGSDQHSVQDSHFEEHPLFTISAQKNYAYSLPKTITHTGDSKKVSNSEELCTLIEIAVSEIQRGKQKLTHFIILKDKNFNYRQKAGLLILQFKNHPFVVKLFLETPRTFLDRYSKGLESYVFTYMGSGTNRHVLGLTRIPNCQAVIARLKTDPLWNDIVIFPRKWFWVHPRKQWLSLVGNNIAGKHVIYNKIPSTYAIIEDVFDTKQHTRLSWLQQRNIIMNLANDLDHAIDPHRPNFIINDHPTKGFTISIIDTEHFPSSVGFKDPLKFSGYAPWYMHMIGKFLKDTYGRSKRTRRLAQYKPASHWAISYFNNGLLNSA